MRTSESGKCRKLIKAWIIPLCIYSGITLLSSFPVPVSAHIFSLQDKVIHVLVYGLLGFFLGRALFRSLIPNLTDSNRSSDGGAQGRAVAGGHSQDPPLCSSRSESVRFGISARVIVIFVLSVVIVSILGVIDEIHQSFVPGRDADPFDILADCIGGLIGSVFVFVRPQLKGKRLS